eukprot:CAMPEP_0170604142 /NCGR_PEP_ID=MMETSP0224-20130122/19269_1 /TAXON_ID=285029 /ORGANISM="Togula jolla, Strain CCCM 725" /LENGTH=42 /DNA_ID= /DNA_START= /DNA_END= /DNA_ORIENTATION=
MDSATPSLDGSRFSSLLWKRSTTFITTSGCCDIVRTTFMAAT